MGIAARRPDAPLRHGGRREKTTEVPGSALSATPRWSLLRVPGLIPEDWVAMKRTTPRPTPGRPLQPTQVEGLEPSTYGFVGRCSIQLSYTCPRARLEQRRTGRNVRVARHLAGLKGAMVGSRRRHEPVNPDRGGPAPDPTGADHQPPATPDDHTDASRPVGQWRGRQHTQDDGGAGGTPSHGRALAWDPGGTLCGRAKDVRMLGVVHQPPVSGAAMRSGTRLDTSPGGENAADVRRGVTDGLAEN